LISTWDCHTWDTRLITAHKTNHKSQVTSQLDTQMWQSQIEIEYYSVAYFERITEFDMQC